MLPTVDSTKVFAVLFLGMAALPTVGSTTVVWESQLEK